MRAKLLWMCILAVLLTASAGYAQRITIGETGGTPPPPPPPPSYEICDNGIDEDGDGVADCDDPDCASDPSCADTVEACENVPIFSTDSQTKSLMVGPGRKGQCTGDTTDSDGRDPKVAGCLTHWGNAGCAAPAVGWRWDLCTSGTNLREVYTTHQDRKSCATPSNLERSCATWLDWHGNNNGILDECPPNSMAVCVNQPLNCGGAVEQVGLCACTVPPKPNNNQIAMPQP